MRMPLALLAAAAAAVALLGGPGSAQAARQLLDVTCSVQLSNQSSQAVTGVDPFSLTPWG
jgi:hypothetical protein